MTGNSWLLAAGIWLLAAGHLLLVTFGGGLP